MRREIVLAFLGVVGALLAPSHLRAQARDTVWVWNAHCRKPSAIALSLRLDRTILFRGTISLCRVERDPRLDTGTLTFRIRPRRPVVWYGYRSDAGDPSEGPGDTTAANTLFDVHMWQGGADTNAALIGFAAAAKDGIHMNSIIYVCPTKSSRDTMAVGLVVEAQPVGRRLGSDAESCP